MIYHTISYDRRLFIGGSDREKHRAKPSRHGERLPTPELPQCGQHGLNIVCFDHTIVVVPNFDPLLWVTRDWKHDRRSDS